MSQAGSPLLVRLTSFGYRYSGIPQDDAGHGGGFVFDCRCLPHPHWEEALRPLTGDAPAGAAFMAAHPEVAAFVGHAAALLLQAARRYAATGELPAQRGREAIDLLRDFPIVRYGHGPLLARVWQLRANLTAYDATYVALAEALRAPLLTADARLAKAPGHGARVEVV